MAENNKNAHDPFLEINKRLGNIESLLVEQVGKLKSIELKLGLEPIPIVQPIPIALPPVVEITDPTIAYFIRHSLPEVPPLVTTAVPIFSQATVIEESVSITNEQPKTVVEVLIEEPVEIIQSPIIEMIEARVELPASTQSVESEAPPEEPYEDYSIGSMESLIAGNWFHRIGIVAVIIGIGFFMREAVKRGWLPPLGRVTIGAMVGIGLVTLGDRLRNQGYKVYSQSLTGGGIAILYLVIFASTSLYGLIETTTAFVLMSLVTALSVYLSARYDAISITVLGLFGGFLTPIMLSTGSDNQFGLFTYIALLDIGVLATAYYKRWRPINIIVFILTIVMFAAWMEKWYDPFKLQPTILFLTLFFIIFAILAVFHNVINRVKSDALDIGMVFINATLYFTVSYKLLQEEHFGKLGLFSISISAFYLALGYFTYSRDRSDKYLLFSFAGLASIFLTLAIPLQLDQHWTTIAWAVEGAALCWIGYKGENKTTQYAALPILLVAVVHWFTIDFMIFGYREGAQFLPVINKRGLSAILVITSLVIAYRCYRKLSDDLSDGDLPAVCIFTAATIGFIWLNADLIAFCDWFNTGNNVTEVSLTILWVLYSASLFAISRLLNSAILRRTALIITVFTITKVWFFNIFTFINRGESNEIHILNKYTIDQAILITLLVYTMRIYSDKKHMHTGLTLIAHFFGLSMLSYESILLFQPHSLMALSVAWGVYGGALLTIGILRDKPLLRYMSFFLLITTTLKVFLIDMSSLDTIYRVISFIVVGTILISASFLYQRQFGKQNEP